MALSIPEVVTTINSLPAEAKQKVLDQIAAQFGPLEAPPKPEPTPEDLKAIEDARKLNEEKAKATAENERRRSEQASKDVIGSLNTLGSDDLKIALSAIGANCGASAAKAEPAEEVEEPEEGDLSGLSKAELLEKARALNIPGASGMNKDELINAIENAQE